MSWTFTMNSEGGSRGLLVSLSTAWAVKVYWACSSRSNVFVAWMLPVLSSITKIVPAPSPDRMYLMLPLPESTSEWSWSWEGGGRAGGEWDKPEGKQRHMQSRYMIGVDNIWISDGVELLQKKRRTGDRSRVRQVVCSTGRKNEKHPPARTLGRRDVRLLFLKSTN